MEFQRRAEIWFDGLTDRERTIATHTVGPLPAWMVASLHSAGIACVQCSFGDDDALPVVDAFLMPYRLVSFLGEHAA